MAEEGEGRTRSLRFSKPPLCLLSYLPMKSRRVSRHGRLNHLNNVMKNRIKPMKKI